MNESEMLRCWLPDEPLAALVESLFHASQLADDIADGDAAPNARNVAAVLHLCMVELPSNPRYAQVWPLVAPVVSAAIHQWAASEQWRRHDDRDVRRWGWAMRDALEQVISVLASWLMGFEHGQRVAVETGIYFRTNHDRETVEEWEIAP